MIKLSVDEEFQFCKHHGISLPIKISQCRNIDFKPILVKHACMWSYITHDFYCHLVIKSGQELLCVSSFRGGALFSSSLFIHLSITKVCIFNSYYNFNGNSSTLCKLYILVYYHMKMHIITAVRSDYF